MGTDFQHSNSAKQTPLPVAQPTTAEQDVVFQHCLQAAADCGPSLFEQLLNDARNAAEVRANYHWGTSKAESMTEGPTLLSRHAPVLAEAFSAALMHAFMNTEGLGISSVAQVKAPSLANLRFDQLELVNEDEWHENVEFARVEQAAKAEAELPLGELNTLVCAVQGLPFVQLERNPFRPASYVAALRSIFEQVDVSEAVRIDWLQLMGVGLGKALCPIYEQLCEMLITADVTPADYNVIPSAPAPLSATPFAAYHSSYSGLHASRLGSRAMGQRAVLGAGRVTSQGTEDATGQGSGFSGPVQIKLTMAQLRHLIAGDVVIERDFAGELGSFGKVAVGEDSEDAEDPFSSEFGQTVPAALEALQEMEQVDQLMARLAGRKTPAHRVVVRAGNAGPSQEPVEPALGATQLAELAGDDLFECLRQQANSVGQVLGLEAVSLMIEKMAADPRLLPSVQAVLRSLTSPLLRLVMVDARFFMDQAHPARQLLDAIVAQGIRFEVSESTSFSAFIQPLKRVIDELQHVPIENAEPFKLSLAKLNQLWEDKAQRDALQGDPSGKATEVSEARMKALAATIADEIHARADAGLVPVPVLEFATGPLSLAMAHAQLASASGEPADDRTLVDDLFWSARPVLAATDPQRLIKMIPSMLSRIRAGLRAIAYPKPAIGEFFEILMALHQKALSDKSPPKDPPVTSVHGALAADPDVPHASVLQAETPQKPQEPQTLQTTGETLLPHFLDHFEFPEFIDGQSTEPMAFASAGISSVMAPVSVSTLPVDATATHIEIGSWVEMTVGGNTMRAQLVWCSPEGSNFMFTTSTGRNQSMTRRSVDALIQRGMVKLLQSRAVPESGAARTTPDAVAQPKDANSKGR